MQHDTEMDTQYKPVITIYGSIKAVSIWQICECLYSKNIRVTVEEWGREDGGQRKEKERCVS